MDKIEGKITTPVTEKNTMWCGKSDDKAITVITSGESFTILIERINKLEV